MANICPVTGKVMHASAAKARRQREHLGGKLNVYRCGNCGALHVGHERVRHDSRRRPMKKGVADA